MMIDGDDDDDNDDDYNDDDDEDDDDNEDNHLHCHAVDGCDDNDIMSIIINYNQLYLIVMNNAIIVDIFSTIYNKKLAFLLGVLVSTKKSKFSGVCFQTKARSRAD